MRLLKCVSTVCMCGIGAEKGIVDVKLIDWCIKIILCWTCKEIWLTNPKEDWERAPFVAFWLMKRPFHNTAINFMGLLEQSNWATNGSHLLEIM